MFGATIAAAAIGGSASAAPERLAATRRIAAQTGPTAKIVIANGFDLDELDPHYYKSLPSYVVVCNTYDGLLTYEYGELANGSLVPVTDEQGEWKFAPWLAESWEVSPDEKTFTFRLRKDLKFQDGTPLTSKDVK
ncbi:MAG: hypothetical protein IT336_04805, partial [Thermomicrobiales bacterium]|nr:hypothetical protein [Thermomicrobiales bacterium]